MSNFGIARETSDKESNPRNAQISVLHALFSRSHRVTPFNTYFLLYGNSGNTDSQIQSISPICGCNYPLCLPEAASIRL